MKLWIARDIDGWLYLYDNIPEKHSDFFVSYNGYNEIRLDGRMFPEVIFENSPQKVEIVLPKTHNKVWHDIEEGPIYVDGVTPIIIDSNYGHISQEGHYYNQFQWKHHIESQKHRDFKWAYEKDLMNL